ncbi:MAG: hypothetical protein KA250_16780 [Verrucomicrobiales bacterium]|nr:hypothetical protein [Verrucomicrobiales bacterium]
MKKTLTACAAALLFAVILSLLPSCESNEPTPPPRSSAPQGSGTSYSPGTSTTAPPTTVMPQGSGTSRPPQGSGSL